MMQSQREPDEGSPIDEMTLNPPVSTLRKIFVGVDGLRAGWGLLIFLAIFAVLIVAASAIAAFFVHSPPGHAPTKVITMTLPATLLNDFIGFMLTLFVTSIMSKIERRRFGGYGLGDSRKFSHFLAGLGWGVSCLSLLVFILWKTGSLAFDRRLLFGSDSILYGAAWLVAFLGVGLFEESITRGYLMFTLTRGLAGMYKSLFKTGHSRTLGFWTAAFVLSLLFALGHGRNPGESPIGLLCAGLAGIVFCLSLWRTGSLWWAIGFHASWDWAQSFLYGTADSGAMVQNHLLATHPLGRPILSGGDTGPEGSAYMFASMLVVSLIIIFTLPRNQEAVAAKRNTT